MLPKRKTTRLKGYDYSTPGAYFITICTKDKKNVETIIRSFKTIVTNEIGKTIWRDPFTTI